MYGTTGIFKTEYKTEKEAIKASENINLLGYETEIKEVL